MEQTSSQQKWGRRSRKIYESFTHRILAMRQQDGNANRARMKWIQEVGYYLLSLEGILLPLKKKSNKKATYRDTSLKVFKPITG